MASRRNYTKTVGVGLGAASAGCATTFPGRKMDIALRDQVYAETEIVHSRYCSKYGLARSAELVADYTIEPVISETAPMEDVPDLMDASAKGMSWDAAP